MAQGAMDLDQALAPGLAGANDESTAITQALNFWNNIVTSSVNPLDDTTQQATQAIALLNAYQTHLNDPTQGYLPN